MTPKLFSPRILFLLPVRLTLAFSLSACAGTQATEAPSSEALTTVAATEESVATEEPPATEAPPATATPPGGTLIPTQIPAQPGIPETRRLTLEFPPTIKAGEKGDVIRLTLEVDDLGNITPTAEIGGHVVEGEVVEIPNLYETHNVVAEARFDIAGIEVQPSGATLQPLRQREPVTFYWSILARETGNYSGVIWLHLIFTDRLSGEESRVAVSAQIVEIEAVDFFGFSTDFVKTSGVVGSVLGVIVGFPFFDDIAKYLWGKLGRRKKKTRNSARKI